MVELIGQHWARSGIQTTVKEVTPDEYRSAQSANKLDVTNCGVTASRWQSCSGTNQIWVPPYHDYFTVRTNMLWAEWVDSKGASGVRTAGLRETDDERHQRVPVHPVGTPESDKLGARLVKNLVENLLFIGTVQVPAPIYHRNVVKNFVEYKTHSFEYYRSYPYRPTRSGGWTSKIELVDKEKWLRAMPAARSQNNCNRSLGLISHGKYPEGT